MTRHAGNEVVLRDIASFHGAEYNPRKMVPERLAQVAVSLRKLGFVLPIYVNKNGTILSGHQRTKAAAMVGYTKVPVVELDVPDSNEKGMNVIFNKGTNDLDTYDGDAKSAFLEYLEKAEGLITDLPDIPPDTYYPCMERQVIPISEAVTMAGTEVSKNLRVNGFGLCDSGVFMPLVVCQGRILNGAGRAHGFAKANYDTVEVVEVRPDQADYAYMALNFLAMDFDIQSNFKDELRFNAFRRKGVQAQIVGLSRTYGYFVYNRIISNTALKYSMVEGKGNPDLELLPTANEEAFNRFKATYGKTIVDLGGGTLHDTRLMQKAGFDMIPFEPYYSGDDSEPNPDASRALISAFLDRIEGFSPGEGPDSIISSFVLNSVPHHMDRMAYLTIMASIARLRTGVFIGTQNTNNLASGSLSHHLRMNSDEPNVTLGNDTRFFKAQKFFYTEELEKMLRVFFAKVEVKQVQNNLFARCGYPKRVGPKLLREACDLEFNLPYKDGSTMGLNDRAFEVLSKYMGL